MTDVGPGGPPAPFAVDHPRRVLVTTAWLVLVIAVLLLLEQHDGARDVVTSVDEAVHRAVVAAEQPVGVFIARVLALLGGVYVTAPLRVLVGLVLARRRRWWWLAAWVGSIAVQEVAVTAMKLFFDRPRPPGAMEVTRLAAFPSGHAAAVSVTIVTVLLLWSGARRAPGRWWALGTVAVAVMAASRVYLRVHWPSDVVMGALVGAASATLVVGSLSWLALRRDLPRGVRERGRIDRRSRS